MLTGIITSSVRRLRSNWDVNWMLRPLYMVCNRMSWEKSSGRSMEKMRIWPAACTYHYLHLYLLPSHFYCSFQGDTTLSITNHGMDKVIPWSRCYKRNSLSNEGILLILLPQHFLGWIKIYAWVHLSKGNTVEVSLEGRVSIVELFWLSYFFKEEYPVQIDQYST